MNEIVINSKDVTYEVPKVTFPSYERYLQRAEDIAAQINALEVTPENVKEAKVTLADARKVTDGLNRIRIDIKKEVLKNYTVFEKQVKELCSIIDAADSDLRGKVRILDDLEREKKKTAIKEIWDKRFGMYSIRQYQPDAFDDFLRPVHLNKSTSMKSVEKDMVAWLEDHDKNLATAALMGDECVAEYLMTDDLAVAIENVKEREGLLDLLHEDNEEEAEEKALFIIKGSKDIAFTETLLKTNNINYERK